MTYPYNPILNAEEEQKKLEAMFEATLDLEDRAEIRTKTELFDKIASDFSCEMGKVRI